MFEEGKPKRKIYMKKYMNKHNKNQYQEISDKEKQKSKNTKKLVSKFV